MNYRLNLGIWHNVFCVPSVVVDNYIKLANENDLKVLLYLLKNSNVLFSSKNISEQLGLSVEETEESIRFWVEREVISAGETGELVPANISQNADNTVFNTYGTALNNDTNNNTDAQNQSFAPSRQISESVVRKVNLERTPDFPPVEIAKTVRNNEDADFLFKQCEKLYGKPLNHNQQNTIMIILEDTCLSAEVALILINYCFDIGKATPSYMRKVALDWADSQITTIEKAEERVEQLKTFNNAVSRFKKMFEVTSSFSKQQEEFIDKWVNVYCFSDEMINQAYQLTLNGTGKLSFPYMNKILTDWHNKGIKTVQQIENSRKPTAGISQKGENSSLNMSLIEQIMAGKKANSGGNQ